MAMNNTISKEAFFSTLGIMHDNYMKWEFVQKGWKAVEGGLSIDDIIYRTMNMMTDNYYRYEVFKCFKHNMTTMALLKACVIQFNDNYYRFEVVKSLQSICRSLGDIVSLITMFNDNYYKFEVIKRFDSLLTWKEIPCFVSLFNDNYYAKGVIERLKDLNGPYGNITILNVIEMIEYTNNSEIRFALVNAFKFNVDCLPPLIIAFNVNTEKLKVIKSLNYIVRQLKEPLMLLDYFDQSVDDGIMLSFVRYILRDILTTASDECIHKFSSEKDRRSVVSLMNLKNVYNNANSLSMLLTLFGDDKLKLKVLKKKLDDTGKCSVACMSSCMSIFCDDVYRYKAFILFMNNGTVIDEKMLLFCMNIVSSESVKLKILKVYPNVIQPKDLMPIITALKSGDSANDFLKEKEYDDVDHILSDAGYDPTKCESLMESDESVDSDDDEVIIHLREGKGIIDIDLNDLDLNPQINTWIPYRCPDNIIQYDTKTRSVVRAKQNIGSIMINGIDVDKEIDRAVYQYIDEKQEAINTQSKLKIPRSWKDTKLKENEEGCIICMANQRKVIFVDCGHYNLCFHCARTIVNGNKQCPTCRKIVTNVVKVYG